jgi:cytidylate kinase
MRVITISRLMGSGGGEVSQRVAESLGYRLVTKRTMEEIYRAYGFLDFDRFYEASHGFWDRFDEVQEQSVELLGKVVRSIARSGEVVILGRASFSFLQGLADVLNVRLWAPLGARVSRVMQERQISDRREAERLVAGNDRIRSRFVELCSRGRGSGPDAFDLAINTMKIPVEAAASLIVRAAEVASREGMDGMPGVSSIAPDPILDGEVAKTLQPEA